MSVIKKLSLALGILALISIAQVATASTWTNVPINASNTIIWANGFNASGTITQGGVGVLTGNQSILFTVTGDATGSASGATSISVPITITGLNGKALPANATGTLYYTGGAWSIGILPASVGGTGTTTALGSAAFTNSTSYLASSTAYVSSFNGNTGATTYSVTCASGCTASTSTTSAAITVTATGGGGATTTVNGASGPAFTFNTTSTTSTVPSVSTSTNTVTFNFPNTQHIQSWTVGPTGATGVDFTSIQNALNACGTAGGGTIYLLAGTYAQATTGLQWKSSNCKIYGDYGSSTITFTGATTLFSTASSGAEYAHNEIHNLTLTGDGNTSDVGIAESNMSHGVYDNLTIDDVGSCFQLHDTVDITFYNTTSNIDCTTVAKYGIDGSSTEPWNGNLFQNIFIGCSSASCISILDGNSEHNTFENIYEEPAGAPLTGSIGVDIFDFNGGTNPGNFGNLWINNYLEGNATAVKVATGTSCGSGECILGDMFIGGISDTNGTLTLPTSTGVTFLGFNNNFQPETTLAAHVGITGSTAMPTVGTCGTGATLDSHSNDNLGLITTAANTTACTVTFAISWPVAPICQAQIASGTAIAFKSVAATASVVFTGASQMPTGTKLDYQCFGDNSQN